jgi:hypothetical protein
MTRFRVLAVLLCASHLLAAGRLSGDAPAVTVSVGFVKQENSPIQIVGLRRPEDQAWSPLLHLVNKTDKATLRIQIETFTANRAGELVNRTNSPGQCGYIASPEDAPNCKGRDERMIPPHGESWTHEHTLDSSGLLIQVHHPACLVAVSQVMAVDFADGSSWRHTYDQMDEVAAAISALGDAQDCKIDGRSKTSLVEFEGTAYSIGRPDRFPDPNPVNSYTFSCSVATLQGKARALCQF